MRLITRGSWGARHGRGDTNITPSRGGVTVHYEGGGKLTGKPHSQCAGRVRGIEDFHVNTRGWLGIAYSYLVCEHGYVFEGRGLGRRTAANGTTSGNQNWYAVCALIGDKDPAADALLTALRDAIDYMRSHGAGGKVNGHRDHLATSCPGGRLYEWVRAGAPRPGTKPGPKPGRLLRLADPLMRGADVKHVQQRLNVHGAKPKLGEDGVFGPLTDKAARSFQKSRKLVVDGIVGPQTLAALEKEE